MRRFFVVQLNQAVRRRAAQSHQSAAEQQRVGRLGNTGTATAPRRAARVRGGAQVADEQRRIELMVVGVGHLQQQRVIAGRQRGQGGDVECDLLTVAEDAGERELHLQDCGIVGAMPVLDIAPRWQSIRSSAAINYDASCA